jgi:hypothetical protein
MTNARRLVPIEGVCWRTTTNNTMLSTLAGKKTNLIIGIIGLLAAVAAIIWMTLIFDSYEVVPDDLDRTVELEGTYTIVDPFVGQLQANAAIGALLTSPESLALIINPAIVGLLGNTALLGAIGDPATMAALGTPEGFAAMLAHPLLGPILADPTVQAVLADPVILGLLADSAAIGMLLDPRTGAMLANPANLPTITIPVLVHRERKATGVDGDTMTINETVVSTSPATGGAIPGLPDTDVTLVVDRSSKVYLEGTDGGRTGQWGLPFHVDKDATYDVYLSVARQPLPAVYEATDETFGMETYRLTIDGTDVPMGVDDPATGLPLVVDADLTIWVDPVTGGGVNATDLETVSAQAPDGTKYVRFSANIAYTDATVETLVADVSSSRDDLILYGTTLPWAIVIIGLILLAIAVGARVLNGKQGASA